MSDRELKQAVGEKRIVQTLRELKNDYERKVLTLSVRELKNDSCAGDPGTGSSVVLSPRAPGARTNFFWAFAA